MSRKVFHSVPTNPGWKVESKGRTISTHRTQAAAEKAAIKAGHKAQDRGGLGQAVLHKAKTEEFERSAPTAAIHGELKARGIQRGSWR